MYKIEKSLDDVIQNHYLNVDMEVEQKNLIKNIEQKFCYYVENTKSFLAEEYVETEWRDSFELYYSRTSYDCTNFVKRIHFISDCISNIDEINDDNYLGYITLRPIPISKSAISRIRLKYKSESFCINSAKNKFFCLSVETTVNFPHVSIKFNSFPIYSQDAMVSVCAHADLLMISKYMFKKYNFNYYKLRDILKNDNLSLYQGRQVPSEGLAIHQIIEILRANNYNPVSVLFKKSIYDNISIIDYINSFLESALPVILAFDRHVIVIVGHTHGEEKHYIIVDDSSYHLSKTFNKDGKQKYKHIALVSENDLLKTIKKIEFTYLIAPTFDRFYFKYSILKEMIVGRHIEELEKKPKTKIEELIKSLDKNDLIKTHLELSLKNYKIKSREILVDSSKLKRFLHECGDKGYSNIRLPHYVWYVEYYLGKEIIAYTLVDATAHIRDYTYSIIRNEDKSSTGLNIVKATMPNAKPLSLLTDIDLKR